MCGDSSDECGGVGDDEVRVRGRGRGKGTDSLLSSGVNSSPMAIVSGVYSNEGRGR